MFSFYCQANKQADIANTDSVSMLSIASDLDGDLKSNKQLSCKHRSSGNLIWKFENSDSEYR